MAMKAPERDIPQENVDRIEELLGLTHAEPMHGIVRGGVRLDHYGRDERVFVHVEYVGHVSVETAAEIVRLLGGGAVV